MDEIEIKKLYEEETQEQFETKGIELGSWTSHSLLQDPKHMGFVLSRYKFCSKILDGKKVIAEIGCGDGFGLPIIADKKETVYAIDWDERLLVDIDKRLGFFLKNVKYVHSDFNELDAWKENVSVEAVVAIDVIEHLSPNTEKCFMDNILKCIGEHKRDGVVIIGTPNNTASRYASKKSEALHCNLKSMADVRELMNNYFYNVFMFGMNDEVVHTGYSEMCHYIWAIGVGVRD